MYQIMKPQFPKNNQNNKYQIILNNKNNKKSKASQNNPNTQPTILKNKASAMFTA